MNWELLLKARMTLPQANKDTWLEHLESEESMTQFMRRLRNGQYETKGIMRTITFLRDDHSDENLENYSSIDHDEEEIVRRFREHKPTMLRLLTNKVNRIKGEQSRTGREHGENVRIENQKQIFDLFDELVEANPSNVKPNSNWGRKLLAIEEALQRRAIIRRIKNQLVAKYSDFFSEWPIPGIVAPSSIATGKKIVGADGEKRDEYNINPAYQSEWWEGNDRKLKTLIGIFKNVTSTTTRYTANTLTAELTHDYYSFIGKWNALLIPDELLDSDLFLQTRRLKIMNPNLLLLIKENQPLTQVTAAGQQKYQDRPDTARVGVGEDKPKRLKEQEEESHQATLREMSGRGINFRKEGYDELVEIKEELLELEEEARQGDGQFSKEKQDDLALLEAFFDEGTHKPFEYKDEEYYNIIVPNTIARRINKLYKEEKLDKYEVHEGLQSHRPKTYENTQEAIETIDLDSLTGDPEADLTLLNLLNTIKEADEALDLDSFSENTSEEFDKSISDIRTTIIQLTQTKVEDIIRNPTNYRKIKPIKSAEFVTEFSDEGEELGEAQSKKEVSIFDALVNKNIIEEVTE